MKNILILGLVIRLVVMVATLHGNLLFIWNGQVKYVTGSVIPKKIYPPLSFLTFTLLSPLYFVAEKTGWWILKLPYLVVDLVIVKILKYWYPQATNMLALREWVSPVVNYEHIALLSRMIADLILLKFICDLLLPYLPVKVRQIFAVVKKNQ